MSNHHPQQCDFCFYSAGPFYAVRILPITPLATLSGNVTPAHSSIPGTRKIVCHHCRYSHYNIEPWTESEELPPSLPTPLESASQPLPDEPITILSIVASDNDQSACNEQNHHVIPLSISSIPPVSHHKEVVHLSITSYCDDFFWPILRNICNICNICNIYQLPVYSFATITIYVSKQSISLPLLPDIQALYQFVLQLIMPARSPPNYIHITPANP